MSKFTRNSNIDEAKVIQVVAVESIAGDGENVAMHKVREYFSLDGELLARTTNITDLSLGVWNEEKSND